MLLSPATLNAAAWLGADRPHGAIVRHPDIHDQNQPGADVHFAPC
jgi:hypothetical protein